MSQWFCLSGARELLPGYEPRVSLVLCCCIHHVWSGRIKRQPWPPVRSSVPQLDKRLTQDVVLLNWNSLRRKMLRDPRRVVHLRVAHWPRHVNRQRSSELRGNSRALHRLLRTQETFLAGWWTMATSWKPISEIKYERLNHLWFFFGLRTA